MSDPAAVLRDAAEHLRHLAGKATKNICPDWTYWAVRHIARNCDIDCGHEVEGGGWVDARGVDHAGWDRHADHEWIVAMSPAVAEPLAAWLDEAAGQARVDGGASHPHVRHALAFASSVLQTRSGEAGADQ